MGKATSLHSQPCKVVLWGWALKTFSGPEKTPCYAMFLCSRDHPDTLGFDGNCRDVLHQERTPQRQRKNPKQTKQNPKLEQRELKDGRIVPLDSPCRNRKTYHLALRPTFIRRQPPQQRCQHQNRRLAPRPCRTQAHRKVHPCRRFSQTRSHRLPAGYFFLM